MAIADIKADIVAYLRSIGAPEPRQHRRSSMTPPRALPLPK
jgi:hypothetical protein